MPFGWSFIADIVRWQIRRHGAKHPPSTGPAQLQRGQEPPQQDVHLFWRVGQILPFGPLPRPAERGRRPQSDVILYTTICFWGFFRRFLRTIPCIRYVRCRMSISCRSRYLPTTSYVTQHEQTQIITFLNILYLLCSITAYCVLLRPIMFYCSVLLQMYSYLLLYNFFESAIVVILIPLFAVLVLEIIILLFYCCLNHFFSLDQFFSSIHYTYYFCSLICLLFHSFVWLIHSKKISLIDIIAISNL